MILNALSKLMTAETKTDVLLIELFKPLVNLQIYGHLDQFRVAIS